VVQVAYQYNVPVMALDHPIMDQVSMFSLDRTNIVLDTVKRAEIAGDGVSLVLRLYESMGGRGTFTLQRYPNNNSVLTRLLKRMSLMYWKRSLARSKLKTRRRYRLLLNLSRLLPYF
jgi:alpha-mannosidase